MDSFLPEGSRVSYIGDGSDGLALGARGELLSRTAGAGHVKWDDGKITLTELESLASVSRRVSAPRDDLADSLDVGPIQAVGLRSVYDTEGGPGALSVMASNGALGGFPAIAEETMTFVAQRIRQDGCFREALAGLDDEESDELVSLAVSVLLRDAFGQGEVDA